MALTTAAETRATLGIDDANAHLIFFYASSAALDTAVTAAITRAVAWLKTRASSSYYTGSSPGPSSTSIDELFKGAEEFAAGHFLFLRLKARKVIGSHYPIDSEESPRFEELIDIELLKLAEELIQPYLDTDLTSDDAVFSLGIFSVTEVLDRTSSDVDCVTDLNQALLDEANCSWSLISE